VISYTQRLQQIEDLCQNTLNDTAQVLMAFTGATQAADWGAEVVRSPPLFSSDDTLPSVRSSPSTTDHVMKASSDDARSASSCTTVSVTESCESQPRQPRHDVDSTVASAAAIKEPFCNSQGGYTVPNWTRDDTVRIGAPVKSCDMQLWEDALFQEAGRDNFEGLCMYVASESMSLASPQWGNH